jgi:hypothetical protein
MFIEDKKGIIKFLNKYMQEVQKNGKIEKGKALEIIRTIEDSENITKTIKTNLFTAISKKEKKPSKDDTVTIPRKKRPRIKRAS